MNVKDKDDELKTEPNSAVFKTAYTLKSLNILRQH